MSLQCLVEVSEALDMANSGPIATHVTLAAAATAAGLYPVDALIELVSEDLKMLTFLFNPFMPV